MMAFHKRRWTTFPRHTQNAKRGLSVVPLNASFTAPRMSATSPALASRAKHCPSRSSSNFQRPADRKFARVVENELNTDRHETLSACSLGMGVWDDKVS